MWGGDQGTLRAFECKSESNVTLDNNNYVTHDSLPALLIVLPLVIYLAQTLTERRKLEVVVEGSMSGRSGRRESVHTRRLS